MFLSILDLWDRLLGFSPLGGRGVDATLSLPMDMISMLSLTLPALKLFFIVSTELLRLLLLGGRSLFHWDIRLPDRFISGNTGIWEFLEMLRSVSVTLVNTTLLWTLLSDSFWSIISVFSWEINFHVSAVMDVGRDSMSERKFQSTNWVNSIFYSNYTENCRFFFTEGHVLSISMLIFDILFHYILFDLLLYLHSLHVFFIYYNPPVLHSLHITVFYIHYTLVYPASLFTHLCPLPPLPPLRWTADSWAGSEPPPAASGVPPLTVWGDSPSVTPVLTCGSWNPVTTNHSNMYQKDFLGKILYLQQSPHKLKQLRYQISYSLKEVRLLIIKIMKIIKIIKLLLILNIFF